jgi:solute carrier family 44 (choline transporter-like protein), member 1
MGYTATKTDMDRLTKGYDDCGNICGRQNNKDLGFPSCKAEDMSKKPKTEVDARPHGFNDTILHYKCVEKCESNYEEIFNRCFKKEKNGQADHEIGGSELNSISEDLIRVWPKLLLTCFIAFIFSYIVLVSFRYAIEYIIWIIYIGFVIFIGIGAIAMWIFWAKSNVPEEKTGLLVGAILLSIFTVLVILLLIWFRKRIELVAQLFKEASKALMDVPTILFEPILTFLSIMISIVLFVFFMIVIETAGNAMLGSNADGTKKVEFHKDGGMAAAQVVNFIAFIWFTQFILGCQHFVIGGTISKWYFARNKTKLHSPIFTTFNHLVRFHLGSVCMGSMLITLVKILQMIVKAIQKQANESQNPAAICLAACIAYLVQLLEELLQYLLRNAYIIVAKDGTPLIESGRKAFGLLKRNLLDVIALNQFGDLVLVVARLFVMGISMLVGYELMVRENFIKIIDLISISSF